MNLSLFKQLILQGIPDALPTKKEYDKNINHAPIRKDILSLEEKRLAIKNALRYFPQKHHGVLAPEFADELKKYGRVYMYRFRPDYELKARPLNDFPHQSTHNLRGSHFAYRIILGRIR